MKLIYSVLAAMALLTGCVTFPTEFAGQPLRGKCLYEMRVSMDDLLEYRQGKQPETLKLSQDVVTYYTGIAATNQQVDACMWDLIARYQEPTATVVVLQYLFIPVGVVQTFVLMDNRDKLAILETQLVKNGYPLEEKKRKRKEEREEAYRQNEKLDTYK